MWQLQTIRTKLLQHISSNSCVAFYRMSNNTEEFVRACSSMCKEPEKACISEVLFVREKACACALKPLLELCLSTWRAPPPNPTKIAFVPNVKPKFLTDSPDIIKPSTSVDPDTNVEYLNVLIECELENEDPEEISILPETEAWKILAWRLEGTRLVLALHGDMSHLTNLASTFLYSETPISRIMTVKFEGHPIALNDDECRALKHGNLNGSPRHCSKYIKTLRNITDSTLKISPTPDSDIMTPIQNHINHTIIPVPNILDKPTEDSPKHIPNNITNGDSVQESPKKHNKLVSRKSDLKLELNNKPIVEKPHARTVTISRMQTLERKSHSKSSLLDEPISTSERKNKGGASCPSLPTVKPPNVLIYSDSAVTRENISRTLRSVLDPDRYAIYSSGEEATLEAAGSSGATLLVAGGALTTRASAALLSAFLNGANVLSLCSDLLISVLPYYQTAEVRERELVSFTYENWKSVKLLHHVFCYQASPARKQFSTSSNAHPTEYKGHGGHILKVEVLAAEQTWHTPSLLRARDDQSGGMAVFSQVHLELDAREYLGTDATSAEQARLGVLRKILSGLGMSTIPSPLTISLSSEPSYTPAYFLGTYERKFETAEAVAVGCLQLIKPKEDIPKATSSSTPLLLHACPEKFSTVLYFQELKTKHLGRLVVYSEILSSTQTILNELTRTHGLVVLADRQTKGNGRGGTVWISPEGCLTFSLQIITSMKNDAIARRAPLLQHIMALSFILAIRTLNGYENINIGIKWPNDIYYAKRVKLGGIILNTNVMGDEMVLNIGFGINLDNAKPTCCLNDIITEHNPKLALLERERLLALTLNHLEAFYEKINETDDFTEFYDLYYKYWLHNDQDVLVVEEGAAEGESLKCRILGIDESGYLKASGPMGEVVLRPDGNTFDMMKGLIAPKLTT